MDNDISVENLLNICAYGTEISIKSARTGQTFVQYVNRLKYSKDKRQKAKWEAIKDKPVFNVKPCTEPIDKYSNVIRLHIQATMLEGYYEVAMKEMKEMKEILKGEQHERESIE